MTALCLYSSTNQCTSFFYQTHTAKCERIRWRSSWDIGFTWQKSVLWGHTNFDQKSNQFILESNWTFYKIPRHSLKVLMRYCVHKNWINRSVCTYGQSKTYCLCPLAVPDPHKTLYTLNDRGIPEKQTMGSNLSIKIIIVYSRIKEHVHVKCECTGTQYISFKLYTSKNLNI